MFKKTIQLTLLCVVFLACKNDPKTDAPPLAPKTSASVVAPVTKDGSATFTITEGTVEWTSTYTIGTKGHRGAIRVEGGELSVNQGQILFGNVMLDMNSVSVTDIKEPGKRGELESHLKDADFFETNKFPKAEFIFTEVMPSSNPKFNYEISGDLTMKGKTARVKIPLKVSFEGDLLRAESPSFPINRTNWGVNFKSGILGTAKDQMIDDMVEIRLKVVAKKK